MSRSRAVRPDRLRAGRGERLPAADGSRGQTTLDFAIGAGVFLVTVAFVVAFVPSMLQPFAGGTQEAFVAADRVAIELVTSRLASPDEPYVLDTACTIAFFREDAMGASDCGFDGNDLSLPGESIHDRIGLSERLDVNVRIVGDRNDDGSRGLLCWDADASRVVEESASNSGCDPGATPADQVLAAGSTPPTNHGSVVVATRFALLDGEGARVEVRLW
jgi:hypothetical protein